jgi:hypothetical protein
LAFEGYRTEAEYFKGISENRSSSFLRIPSMVDVCVLSRHAVHSGHSDPFRVLDLLDDHMSLLRDGTYTLELFASMFLDAVIPEDDFSKYEESEIFLRTAMSELDRTADLGRIRDVPGAFGICNEICLSVFGFDPRINCLAEQPDFIDGHDVVCVMIDRDRDSRTSSKCGEFISRCNRSGYVLFMTNPCFEMWLLLHFDDVLYMDRDLLLSNPKGDGRRYTERALDDILLGLDPDAGYDKTRLDFGRFVHRTDNAIENELFFCHDLGCIRSDVGSNIGSLIGMMRQRDRCRAPANYPYSVK